MPRGSIRSGKRAKRSGPNHDWAQDMQRQIAQTTDTMRKSPPPETREALPLPDGGSPHV